LTLDELMGAKPRIGDLWTRELPLLLLQLDRATEYLDASAEGIATPWLHAGVATASGRLDDAARVHEEIGARADAAAARMGAAEAASAAGRREEAERQLALALDFYRRAGAIEYVRRGEMLLASSA
jgi:hypothetical protein